MTARPPYPLDTGAKIRTWHVLAGFASCCQVDVLHYLDPAVEEDWCRAAQALGIDRVQPVNSPGINKPVSLTAFLSATLKKLPVSTLKYMGKSFDRVFGQMSDGKYDILHVDTIHLAQCMYTARRWTQVPLITLNAHNVEYQIAERMCSLERSLARRLALKVHARNMRSFELRAFNSADMVFSVSDEDRTQIDAMAGEGKGVLVENGVDVTYYSPRSVSEERCEDLVFVGSMDWLPNIDGMKWFVREVLPAIKAARPEAHLTIVGRSPHLDVQAMHNPEAGVVVTGTVDDVRPFIGKASVVIVPLRFGGGTRLKILEAFAMGKAVVSTSLGCEGILCKDDTHLLIRDDRRGFADACLKLMAKPEARRALGEAGRLLAGERYSWEAVVNRMLSAVQDVFSQRRTDLKGDTK